MGEWKTWRFAGIYGIWHRESGKIYIGQSQNMAQRIGKHKRGCNSPRLRSAIMCHGWDAFEKVLLERVDDLSLLNIREQYWIDFYDSANPEKGYNLRPIAESNRGWHPSDEVRKNMSIGQNRPEVRAIKSANVKEYQNRPEVKAARSAYMKEYHNRPEVRAANSARQKEHTNRPDVKAAHTACTKEYMNRPEVRAANSARTKEYQNRPEVRAANSAAHLGVTLSSEHRARISVSGKNAWLTRGARQRVVDHAAAEAAGQLRLLDDDAESQSALAEFDIPADMRIMQA